MSILEIIRGALELIKQLINIGSNITKMVKDAETQNWINDLSTATDKLANAKSISEKLDAARRFSALTGKLP